MKIGVKRVSGFYTKQKKKQKKTGPKNSNKRGRSNVKDSEWIQGQKKQKTNKDTHD